MRDRITLLASVVALLAGGCSDGTAPATPAPDAPSGASVEAPATPPEAATPPDQPATRRTPGAGATGEDPTVARFAGFEAPKPATWLWQPPQSSMRAANYVVPGRDGSNQAHLVVFQGIGGGVEANVARWTGQFRTPDQYAVEPILTLIEVDGMPVTVVELAGEYMAMGQNWFTPDHLFLGAIVEAPEGDLFIHLVGQTATVEANREPFMTLVRGLRRAG